MEITNTTGVSENVSWTMQKGSFVTHFTVTILMILLFRTFFSSNLSWQLTVLSYNIVTFIFFHWLVGDPFDHNYCDYTFWEQMNEQLPKTSSIIFLCAFPVVLFAICNHVVQWGNLFLPCVFSLCLVVVPKLGFMHRKRLFGMRRKA
ncbi:hypothetical protein EDEG_03282 [Edhazardia aedis USNM 41457]|uniref:ORMDL family protein n=1 Tax=Edhazardia aedis (strain USNM 41457) TaxID=1003232 RepID=J9D365_EDHAE|nr:hypothetical protein EDEG_03282 [Edhazardia aedis USNM 41457]|eukprot:EJW02276.1 hypothetical protein EDEG_03282 [Edhazardia aedis USNM 41457]